MGSMSNKELVARIEVCVRDERKLVVELIGHLAEMRRRRLHLDLGYSSMFAYCIERLGLDESTTWQRLQVAGAVERYPEVLLALADKRVSLSVAAMISPLMDSRRGAEILTAVNGKTKREAEVILAKYRKPKHEPKPGIRKAGTLDLVAVQPDAKQDGKTLLAEEKRDSETLPAEGLTKGRMAEVEVVREDRYSFRFSGDEKLKAKIERLAEVLGIGDARGKLDEVIDRATEIALEAKDPFRKEQRRQARSKRATPPAKRSEKQTRHIPAATRAKVLKRSGYACEYRGEGGRRCGERNQIQVDHVKPWAMGGGHGEENLRVLCRGHNLRKAERDFEH